MSEIVLYIAWGALMAVLVGYGGAAIIWGEYRRGIPCLIAGLTLYAAVWFTQ